MNYKILFLVSIIIFLFLSITNVIVLSSGRIQIGTPLCSTFRDYSGTRCASILCSSVVSGGEPNGSTCYDDQGIPTHLNEQSVQICELPNNACVVTDPIACDAGNRSASYGRECASGGVQTVSRGEFLALYLAPVLNLSVKNLAGELLGTLTHVGGMTLFAAEVAVDVEADLQSRAKNLPKKFHPICVVRAIRAHKKSAIV